MQLTLKAALGAAVVVVMLGVAVLLAARGQPLDVGWGGLFAVVFGSALGVHEAAGKLAQRAAPKPEDSTHE